MKSISSTIEQTDKETVFEIMVDQVPVGVCIIQDRYFRYANDYFLNATGYMIDELIDTDSFEIVVPEDREIVRENTIRILKGEVLSPYQFKVICKDSTIIWVMATVKSIKYQGRQAVLGNYMEITERKKLEEALKQSEEKYKALFDSSVIGTVVVDSENMKIVMANKAAGRMFGFSSAEEMTGVNLVDFIPLEDRDRICELFLKEFFEQELQQIHELRMIAKNGREIWISANGARIMHEDKSVGLACFTNITEQKRQNERLMMTDRLASLGELASGAAHELNNPLTSIIGFSELLMEKEIPDEIAEELKLINSEARRAVNVTNNLLSFARKHSSTKQINQINNIIEDVLELRAHEHNVNRIKIERHLDPTLPEVVVDYFQMQQVFMNIIINAEYFMIKMHNGGTLAITTKKENSNVNISFADDGPGITEENLGRIFDPFFTTKEAGNGTGLGLSICHGIVNEHGGQIYVKSQLGKGATIFVELPVKKRTSTKSLI